MDTVREPLLVLDADTNILFASGSFHRWFHLDPDATRDRRLFALDDGMWDLPPLHLLIDQVMTEHGVVEGFEIAHEFPRIGPRVLLLHARKMTTEDDAPPTILLAFEDITERRAIERDKAFLQKQTDDLLLQKQMLLEEIQHRIVNSLQTGSVLYAFYIKEAFDYPFNASLTVIDCRPFAFFRPVHIC